VTSAPAAVTVLAPGTALVTVGHRAVEATVLLGDPVTLDVSITNAGNVPLTGVTITAPGAPECGGPITDPIPVGGEHVVECSHTPTEVGTWSSTVSVTSVELPDPTTSPTITVDVLAVTVRRPDGWIRKGISGPIAGDDLYNTTGAQQNRVVKLTRAQRQVTFFVTAQNDGTHPERLRVRGQPSTTHYTVRYFSAGQDVTTRVNNGTFRTPVLAPGLTRTVKVVVTARPTAPLGGQVDRRVTISSVNDPTKVDVVRFIVKRR
jgi:hypothetical protein